MAQKPKTSQRLLARDILSRHELIEEYLRQGDPTQMETEPDTRLFEGRVLFVVEAAAAELAPHAREAWRSVAYYEERLGEALSAVEDLPYPFNKPPESVTLNT